MAINSTQQKASPNKRQVLVVEDNEDLSEYMTEILADIGFSTTSAYDGEEALQKIEQESFDLVFLDLHLPKQDGISTFIKAKELAYTPPFVAVTGDEHSLNVITAEELGFFDLIRKPYSKEDILNSIEVIKSKIYGVDVDESNNNEQFGYCRVPISDFVTGSQAPLDIYVKVGRSRYIRVGKKGSPLSQERTKAYQEKGMKFIYIKQDQFPEYVKFNSKVLNAAQKLGSVQGAQNVQLNKHIVESSYQDMYINGLEREKFDKACEFMNGTIDIIKDSKNLTSLLDSLKGHSDTVFSHSVGVGLYSSLLAHELGWEAEQTIIRLAMAGLLHDIGKKELPPEILDTPRVEMTPEQLEIYETHPAKGKEILSSMKTLSNDIILVAYEHHENVLGTGFPNRKSKLRIHPFSLIVSLIDEFCTLVISESGEEAMSAHEAIERIYSVMVEEFDLGLIKALMLAFKYPIPEELANRNFKRGG